MAEKTGQMVTASSIASTLPPRIFDVPPTIGYSMSSVICLSIIRTNPHKLSHQSDHEEGKREQ
ncbi:MAG: hypothetical protein ACYDHM_10495 [Acidiferrobacterales bacterium]